MPWMLSFWWIAAARGSVNMANSDGESGHPCLVPLSNANGCDVTPLVVTVAMGDVYSLKNQIYVMMQMSSLLCQRLFLRQGRQLWFSHCLI